MRMSKLCIALSALAASAAFAQTKWDMPTAYSPASFHTVNINQFIADIDKAAPGKLKITVHPGGAMSRDTGTPVTTGTSSERDPPSGPPRCG